MAGSPDIYDNCNFPGERKPEDAGHMFSLGILEGKLYCAETGVAVISDRGPLNLESLTDYAGHNRSFGVKGVILPGSELDRDMTRLVVDEWVMAAMADDQTAPMERLRSLDSEGNLIDRGDFVIKRSHAITGEEEELFRLAHESYDPAKLRQADGEGPAYRRSFGNRLIRHLQHMDPSVIFLDNFKVILPETVVEAFPGKLVNVHPSVLPLIKGYRPEKRAFEGENPEANGYTMHVVSEELDGGATLLQQRVPIMPVDEARREEMGDEAYEAWREEQARFHIMVAQSPFVPWVLHIYNSGLDRIIVEDAEAFAAEGRPGFEDTDAYKEAIAEDPAVYQRVLFENPLAAVRTDEPKFITLEKLLSVPPEADVSAQVSGLHHYRFKVPVLAESPGSATFTHIEHLVEDMNASGFGAAFGSREIKGNTAEVTLRTFVDCGSILANMGVVFDGAQQRVHVRTPREPVAADKLPVG